MADFGVQAIIKSVLRREFPNDRIVAEESSKDLTAAQTAHLISAFNKTLPKDAQAVESHDTSFIKNLIDFTGNTTNTARFWTIDPIDGTKGFLRQAHYAVCLALIEGGRPVVGVLGCPNLTLKEVESTHARHRKVLEGLGDTVGGTMLYATRGEGAFVQGLSEDGCTIRIPNEHEDAGQDFWSMARMTESYESSHSNHGLSSRTLQRLRPNGSYAASPQPLRIDSQCKYASVAVGMSQLYLRFPRDGYQEKIWVRS